MDDARDGCEPLDVKQKLVAFGTMPRYQAQEKADSFMSDFAAKLEEWGLHLFDPANPRSDAFIVRIDMIPSRGRDAGPDDVTLIAKITYPSFHGRDELSKQLKVNSLLNRLQQQQI